MIKSNNYITTFVAHMVKIIDFLEHITNIALTLFFLWQGG